MAGGLPARDRRRAVCKAGTGHVRQDQNSPAPLVGQVPTGALPPALRDIATALPPHVAAAIVPSA